MKLYGHRGDTAARAPENSMIAFRQARDRGVGIETDLRLDADGIVILFHDRCIADRRVDTLTRDEISRKVGHRVPTLAEFLDEPWSVPVNFDMKSRDAFERALPQLNRDRPDDLLITAFDHSIPHDAAHLGFEAGLLTASAPHIDEGWPTAATRLSTVVWHFDMVTPEIVERARNAGLRIIVYGPTTRGEHLLLQGLQVDGIITDHLDTAVDLGIGA